MDAKALAGALRAAISAWDSEQDLTIQQPRVFVSIPKTYDSYIIEVADHAVKGGFIIYSPHPI